MSIDFEDYLAPTENVGALTTQVSAQPEEIDSTERRITISENDNRSKRDGWRIRSIPIAEFEHMLTTHTEIASKEEARVFVPGKVAGDRRTKENITSLSALVLDLDRGDELDAIVSAIESTGLHAFIHSTHSHLIDIARVKSDDYRKFVGGDGSVTEDALREYLSKRKGIDSKFLVDITILSTEDDVIVVQHQPIPKYRVLFPLARPFTRQEHGEQFEPMWEAKYLAQAGELGLRCDESCTDVSRLFYGPSCMPGAQRVARTVQGRLLDIDDIQVPAQPNPTGSTKKAAVDPWLLKWIAKYRATFEIETALRSHAPPTIFRQGRSGQPGVHIDCPSEDTHTDPGNGTGTFVVNASENDGRGFGVHCCHAHCLSDRGNGTAVDRLAFVEKMLDLGWLDRADLENAVFGGGPVAGERRSREAGDLRVVDREGRGVDAAVLHNAVIATGDLALDGLNQRCGIQMASDVTAEHLADFIETGRVTVKDLIGGLRVGSQDPYEAALLIARQSG